MEGSPLSMAGPCMEGSLGLHVCASPFCEEGTTRKKVQEVGFSSASLGVNTRVSADLEVLKCGSEVPAPSSSKQVQPSKGIHSRAALDLESRRGCAGALSSSTLVDLDRARGGTVRPSPSPDLVKTSEIQAAGTSPSSKLGVQRVPLTGSGQICLKDQIFEKEQLDSDVSCTGPHQLLDGTGLQTIDGSDLTQRLGPPHHPSSDGLPSPPRGLSCVAGLPLAIEGDHGEEARRQRALKGPVAVELGRASRTVEPRVRPSLVERSKGSMTESDQDLLLKRRELRDAGANATQICDGTGAKIESRPPRGSYPQDSARPGRSLGAGRAPKPAISFSARERGSYGSGNWFKKRAGRDASSRARSHGESGRSGLRVSGAGGRLGSGPDLAHEGDASGGYGVSSQVGEECLDRGGGREARRRAWGRGQRLQLWVGSSSSGFTDDYGAVAPDRIRRSVPRTNCVDWPHLEGARDRTNRAEVGAQSVMMDMPPRNAFQHSQRREGSLGVMDWGGEAGISLKGSEISEPKQSAWSDIVRGGSEKKRLDRNLQFIPPSVVDGRRTARCSIAETNSNLQRWHSSLVGRVMGRRPFFPHLKKSLERSWRLDEGLEMYSREEGIFIVRFPSEESCLKILESGPWFFEGRLILLRRWEKGGTSERALLHKAPLWIRLPLLPLELWTKENLSRIVSAIGTPLHVDQATAARSRIGYARCCVEVGFDDVLQDVVPVTCVEDEGYYFLQDIIYDWKPPRCEACRTLGHTEGACQRPPSELVQRGRSLRDQPLWRRVRNVDTVSERQDGAQTVPILPELGEKAAVGAMRIPILRRPAEEASLAALSVSVGSVEGAGVACEVTADPAIPIAGKQVARGVRFEESGCECEPLPTGLAEPAVFGVARQPGGEDGNITAVQKETVAGLDENHLASVGIDVSNFKGEVHREQRPSPSTVASQAAQLPPARPSVSPSFSACGAEIPIKAQGLEQQEVVAVSDWQQNPDHLPAVQKEGSVPSLLPFTGQPTLNAAAVALQGVAAKGKRAVVDAERAFPPTLPDPAPSFAKSKRAGEVAEQMPLCPLPAGDEETLVAPKVVHHQPLHQGAQVGDAEDIDLAYLSQGDNANLKIKKEKLLEAKKLKPAQVILIAPLLPGNADGEIMTFETIDGVEEFLDIAGAQEVVEYVHRLIRKAILEEDGVAPPACTCDYCSSIDAPFPAGFRILQKEGVEILLEQSKVSSGPQEGGSPVSRESLENLLDKEHLAREEGEGEEEGMTPPAQQKHVATGGDTEIRDEGLDPLFDWSKVPRIPPCLENMPNILVCPNPEYEQLVGNKGGGREKERTRDRGKEREESKKKKSQKLRGVASSLGLGRSTRSQGGATVVVPLEDLPP